MIYDNIKNKEKYKDTPWIYNCLDEIERLSDPSLAIGRYPIEKDGVPVGSLAGVVNRYTTHTHVDNKYENHHDWVDIQYILSGRENIRVCHTDSLAVAQEYDEGADYEFFAEPKSYTTIAMEEGDFLVLLPGEAHEPNLNLDTETDVQKIVFKVKVSEYNL